MHWADAQLLVAPFGRRYRAAPSAASPLLAEARGTATLEELRERHSDELRSYLRLRQERRLAEHPDSLEAPALWPATVAQLTAEAALRALVERHGLRGAVIAAISLMDARIRAQRALRRRAARRRGLTVEDAPRPDTSGWTYFALVAALRFWSYLFGGKPPQHAWHFWLAVGIVKELEERRSWRQARRTSIRRPLSSD